jgi:hypothetical protein
VAQIHRVNRIVPGISGRSRSRRAGTGAGGFVEAMIRRPVLVQLPPEKGLPTRGMSSFIRRYGRRRHVDGVLRAWMFVCAWSVGFRSLLIFAQIEGNGFRVCPSQASKLIRLQTRPPSRQTAFSSRRRVMKSGPSTARTSGCGIVWWRVGQVTRRRNGGAGRLVTGRRDQVVWKPYILLVNGSSS